MYLLKSFPFTGNKLSCIDQEEMRFSFKADLYAVACVYNLVSDSSSALQFWAEDDTIHKIGKMSNREILTIDIDRIFERVEKILLLEKSDKKITKLQELKPLIRKVIENSSKEEDICLVFSKERVVKELFS